MTRPKNVPSERETIVALHPDRTDQAQDGRADGEGQDHHAQGLRRQVHPERQQWREQYDRQAGHQQVRDDLGQRDQAARDDVVGLLGVERLDQGRDEARQLAAHQGKIRVEARSRIRFGEILVEPQGAAHGARDLGNFERVGQPGAEQVALVVDEHLGLVFQPAEGRGMDDAVAVALILAAVPRRGLRVTPAPTLRLAGGIRSQVAHPSAACRTSSSTDRS